MPISVPTKQIPDERILRNFYNLMYREAQKQGFNASVFPVIGDVDLNDMMGQMRKVSPSGLWYYQKAFDFGNGSLPEKVRTVRKGLDSRVIDSWQSWLDEIALDRTQRRIHARALDEITKRYPSNKDLWLKYDEIARKIDRTKEDKREMERIQGRLRREAYIQVREELMPKLFLENKAKVYKDYKLPTGESFQEALDRSSTDERIYRTLVELNAGFRLRN